MTIFERFGNWFMRQLPKILTFLTPLGKQILAGGGDILKEAALIAVANVDLADITNEQKFLKARDAVYAVLKAKGIPLIENAIQGAIIAAVAELHLEE